ncbi:MAG TPA: phospholipid carrier-dependent glycosyltransferase [Methylomirabilota bacterium]|nr:phospholipid carrier-dependent glycosyltransferase [Methylomirabilota bacterium]
MSPRASLLGLLLVFIAGLVPFAGTFFEHYPDERNYTNAAITMLNTGEYLTPRWPDGHPNVHKPVLTYWVVAASYALFGISLPASRAPFMVAGALVVALTYALALRLTGSRETAILATLITLSQAQLILASMRAIPDVLLCLFMLLSAYGFLSLVALDRRTPHAYWAAYLGAALAVATKGLLAVVFVAFAWLFAWFARRDEPPAARLRSVLHLPSMLVAAALAGWWYVAIYRLHGSGPARVFVGDQITWNLAVVDGSPLHRIPTYLAFLLINLLPWSLLLIPLALHDRQSLVPRDTRERRAQRFVIAWSVLIAIIFGFGQKVEPRYILPAGPLWAILLATALERADARRSRRAQRSLLTAILAVLAGFGVVVAALDASVLGPRPALLALALFAALTATIALATGEGGLGAPTGVALAVLLVFSLTVITLGPALEPDAGVRAMARELERARRDGAAPVLVTGPEFLANKLRVLTGGRVAIDSWSRLEPAREAWPAMVLPAAQAATLDLKGYRSREVATEVRSVPVVGLLTALWNRRVPEFLDARRDRYVIAIRR